MTSLCIKGSPLKTQSNENEASRERARRIVGLRRDEMEEVKKKKSVVGEKKGCMRRRRKEQGGHYQGKAMYQHSHSSQ